MTIQQYIAEQYRNFHQPKPWFGSGMEESLEPIPEADFHRPIGHRSIAGLIGHVVAWWRDSYKRLMGLSRDKIELNSPQDWPDYSGKSKAEMLAELAETGRAMTEALEQLSTERLEEKLHADYYYTIGDVIIGNLQHDTYHLGQINLLAALLKGERDGNL